MSWSIFEGGGSDGSVAVAWAKQFLQALGAPLTASNIAFVYNWEKAEGAGGVNNPLNQGPDPNHPDYSGGSQYGGGAADYATWNDGIQGAVDYLNMSNYAAVKQALMNGDGASARSALVASPWAANHYDNGSSFPNETPPGGTAVDLTAASSSIVNTTPSLDMPTLEQESGIAAAVVNSSPELKRLFQEAVSGGWSTARFTSQLQNTAWYKSHSDTYRQFLLTRYTDPATYNQNMKQEVVHIQMAAASMGAVISQAYATNLASSALAYNWSSEQLQNILAGSVWYTSTGHLGGDAGKQEMTLRGLAASNGVDFDQNWYLDAARKIEQGVQSEQYYEGLIRKQAATTYKAYANQINSGMNLSDLASGYIQSMSKVLEINSPTLNDPTIRKALQWTNPSTNQVEQMPIWQFEDQLRQDPRWLKTDNARDSMYSVAHTVLQNFGFMGA